MKNQREESAYWERIFDQVARESDPQLLHKYLDRLIRALDDRKAELGKAPEPTEAPGQDSGEQDSEEKERSG